MRRVYNNEKVLCAVLSLLLVLSAFAIPALAVESQTVVPSQNNSKDDAKGDFSYAETALTLDYNGIELAATLAMPDAEEAVPIIIMCHGYTGSQSHFSSYAEVFATNGIASIRFDFPAHGKSGGESTEISLLTEKAAAEFMLEYAKTVEGIDLNQINMCGQSMGGLVATLCAVEHQDEIQAVILYYPGYPILQFTKEGYVLGTEFDTENVPESLEIYNYTVGSVFITDALELDVYGEILPALERDVLIFHGTTDDMIDLKYSEEAIKVLPSAQLVIVDGCGHGFPGFVLADIMPLAVEFVQEHVG